MDQTLSEHKAVVADGLNLQIIIKTGDLTQLVPRAAVDHGAEKLARLAGAAQKQALAVLDQDAFGDARFFIKIFQMGLGDQLIQILKPRLVLHQNNLVIGTQLFGVTAREARVDLGNVGAAVVFL